MSHLRCVEERRWNGKFVIGQSEINLLLLRLLLVVTCDYKLVFGFNEKTRRWVAYNG